MIPAGFRTRKAFSLMFRRVILLYVLSSAISFTPVHFAQYPSLPQPPTEPWNLPGTRHQQPHSAGLGFYAHSSGSIPTITIHSSPDSVSSIAYSIRPCPTHLAVISTYLHKKRAIRYCTRVPRLMCLLSIPKLPRNISNLASNTMRQTDWRNQPSVLSGVQRNREGAE